MTEAAQTETPETDKEARVGWISGIHESQGCTHIKADFARDLERRLREMTEIERSSHEHVLSIGRQLAASQESLRAMTAEKDKFMEGVRGACVDLMRLSDELGTPSLGSGEPIDADKMLDAIKAMRASKETAERELEACRLDAERYRWLRKVYFGPESAYKLVGPTRTPDEMDEAIDASRQAGA